MNQGWQITQTASRGGTFCAWQFNVAEGQNTVKHEAQHEAQSEPQRFPFGLYVDHSSAIPDPSNSASGSHPAWPKGQVPAVNTVARRPCRDPSAMLK